MAATVLHSMRRRKISFFLGYLLVFFCTGEITARLYLSYERESARLLLYGVLPEKGRLQKVSGLAGEAEYFKLLPSASKQNPVNSSGLRGPELANGREDVIRVVCLGGSTTYGDGLPYEETYPKILQDMLDTKFGRRCYEIINAGQPGMDLAQIVSFTEKEMLDLNPDIVLLMSVVNNFQAPGFWFIGIEGEQNKGHPLALKTFLTRRSALLYVLDINYENIAQKGFAGYFVNFDYKAFADALVAPDNIWESDYKRGIERLSSVFIKKNPRVKIFFLIEPFNFTAQPSMRIPYGRVEHFLQEVAADHVGFNVVNLSDYILSAARKGGDVWQSPAFDMSHLSKAGNEIIAAALMRSLLRYAPCHEQQ